MLKMVLLSKIKDNQYRDKKRNPLVPVRVEHLTESIKTTGFWKGVYGREQGEFVQITFGHGRVEAARKVGLKEIPVEIEELTNSDMLKRMTRENLRGELLVALEAVNAAVKAAAAGEIEFEAVDPSTRKDALRYAPSFVPGKNIPDPSNGSGAYTVDTLARFLGGVYVKAPLEGRKENRATELVSAALGMLEMEERDITGFSEKIMRVQKKSEGDDNEEVGYIGAREIIKAVSDIKRDDVFDKAKAEKRQEELDRYNAKQKELEEQRKAHEESARLARESLIQKQLKAKEEEDTKEIKRLAQKMREQAAATKLKQIADSEKLQAIEAKVSAAKKKAEEAKKEDSYQPVRREVERTLFKMENSAEGSSFAELVKSLARMPLNANDRERLRQGALKVGSWWKDWVAVQFLPPTKSDILGEARKREKANRDKEKEEK